MWHQNRTGDWLSKKGKEEQAKIMALGRKKEKKDTLSPLQATRKACIFESKRANSKKQKKKSGKRRKTRTNAKGRSV